MFFQEKAVILQPEVVFYVLIYLNLEIKNILYNEFDYFNLFTRVVYILQILKSRTSYTTEECVSEIVDGCVYPSNLEIKNILYNIHDHLHILTKLCISFKSWNQEHPIQHVWVDTDGSVVVYILQILKSRTSYTTPYYLI